MMQQWGFQPYIPAMSRPLPAPTKQDCARNCALSILFFAACVFAPGCALAATGGASTDVIAGHRLESLTIKNPDSAVCLVFENGLRGALDSWSKVIEPLGASASIFAYNRPGSGNSEATDTPRDGATIVEELRQTLKQKGLRPPYILVGHSLGGLYMQLFASRHPDEVGGLVLVDALYPKTVRKPEDFPLLARAAKRLFFSASVNHEIDLIYQTGEQLVALGPIDGMPIVQLINRPKGRTAIPLDLGVMNEDRQSAAFVRAMYPKATKIFLDSDHQMQKESPVEVAAAIRDVIAKASGQQPGR
jgi:pimeloyl-ACP methyl ester carboxylesterase